MSIKLGSLGFIRFFVLFAAGFVLLACQPAADDSQSAGIDTAEALDRTRLPVPQPAPQRVTEALPENVPLPSPWSVSAPEGAPNVIIILLDDIGFGGPSPFGGPINMPTLQGLADNGLSYNRFHTIA